MPPFQVPYAASNIYQPNGRLVDLIRLQGLQTAEGQRRAGEIQAQMWGNLGQTINAGVGNVLKAQQEAPINALNQIKVKEAQDVRAGQQTIDDALKTVPPQGPVEPGQPPLAATHPYMDDHGLIDPTKVRSVLEANGLAHVAPDLLAGVEKMNDGILKHTKLADDLAKSNITMLGDWANGVTNLVKAQVPIDRAMDLTAQPYLVGKKIDPQAYAAQKAQILSLPPEQQQAALEQFMSASELANPDETLNKDAERIGRYGRVKASNIVPDKLGAADLEKAAMDAYGRQSQGSATPADLATITAWEKTHPHPAAPVESAQSIDKLVLQPDGKTWTPTTLMFDPKTKKYTDASGKEIADAATHIRPIPSASAVAINAGQLSDVAMEQAARKYLETGILPPGYGTAGTLQKTAIMNAAAKLDPTAALARNQATFKADSANLTNLTKTEGALSAFENAAGKNIQMFLDLTAKLPDSGVPWLNTPLRELNDKLVGAEWMPAVNAARRIGLREVARVTNDPGLKGQLTDTARKEVDEMASGNATIAQMKRVFPVLIRDMANVHTGLKDEITSVKNSLGQNPNAPAAAASTVPANVAAALKGQQPGIHTLSDGSRWMIAADGAITKQ